MSIQCRPRCTEQIFKTSHAAGQECIPSVQRSSWNLKSSVTEGSKVKESDHWKASFLKDENLYYRNETQKTTDMHHLSGRDLSV